MTELAAGFSDNIKKALAVLPEKPGVYLMHCLLYTSDAADEL